MKQKAMKVKAVFGGAMLALFASSAMAHGGRYHCHGLADNAVIKCVRIKSHNGTWNAEWDKAAMNRDTLKFLAEKEIPILPPCKPNHTGDRSTCT